MTMARYSGVVQDQAGNIITNAKIEVRREQPGQPLAALKSDRAGSTPLVNPFDADADGSFAFHVTGGAYKIRAYVGPSGAPTFEAPPRRYVGIGLGSETDSVAGGAPFAIVRVVATANVAIASALEAGDTLDGVTLVAGDFILLTSQTAPAENGVYEVPASGVASRAAAFSTYDSMPGCYFSVMEGTAGADKLYRCTSNRGGTLETDAIVISEFSGGGVAVETHAASSKTTPVDADEIPLVDSAASNVLKKLTWASLKAALSSTFLSSGFVRERLAANRTYYVRTDGSNSNTGLANTAGGAFLTIQKAVDVVYGNLDLAGFSVTIQLGNTGTWTENIIVQSPQVGAGTITISGDTTTANTGSYIVTSSSGATIVARTAGSVLQVQGFELRSASDGMVARDGGVLRVVGFMRFGACTGRHLRAFGFGQIVAESASWYVVGNALDHLASGPSGYISTFGSTITIPAATSVAISGAFAMSDRQSILSTANTTIVVTGTVTGQRYNANNYGLIYTNGGGANFFPGNSAGTDNSGAGKYV